MGAPQRVDGGILFGGDMTTPQRNQREESATKLRIDEVYRLLLCGARRREIIKYANHEGWGASSRTIDKYIAKAKEELASVSEGERREAFGVALKRLDTLLYKSMMINDFKTALAVIKEFNHLHGLGLEKVEHTVEISESEKLWRVIDAAIAADPSARSRLAEALSDEEEDGGEEE